MTSWEGTVGLDAPGPRARRDPAAPRGTLGGDGPPEGGAGEAVAAGPEAGRRSLPYNPAFDGLRGVAVAAVLAFHGGFSWARGGYLGVSTFFTLSGFLITSLILAEHRATGRLDLRRFWARRVRRLLPASALTLLGVSVWALATDALWERGLRGDELAAVFQVANWRFLFDDRSYAELFAAPSPLLHFWSLAIEEQFYWLFPLLATGVLAARRGSLRALGAVVAALLTASVALGLALGPDSMDAVYYATPTRMAEILAGALLAVVVTAVGPRRVQAGGTVARATAVAGVVAVVASLWAYTAVSQTDPALYRGGLAVYAALSAAVVLACTVPGPVRSALAWAPFRLLGIVSYGVYLAHWPIFLWLDEDTTGWSGIPLFAVRVAATLAVAIGSYVLVERPVRHGGRVPRMPMPALAAGTVAVVALVAVVVPAVSPPADDPFAVAAGEDPDLRWFHPEELPDGARVAVLLGDSTMLTLAAGLNRWGLETEGGVVAVNGLGGLGCSIARGGERRYAGEVGAASPHCDQWATRIPEATDRIRDTYGRVDVALLGTGPWDVVDRRLPGEAGWRSPGDPAFDAYLRAELEAATDAFLAEGVPVVWLTTPYLDVGRQMQPPPAQPFPESDPQRVDLLNDMILDVAEAREGVAVVDLGGYLAGLSTAEEERLRPDGVHLERDAAEEVSGDWLGRAIVDAVPTPPGSEAVEGARTRG